MNDGFHGGFLLDTCRKQAGKRECLIKSSNRWGEEGLPRWVEIATTRGRGQTVGEPLTASKTEIRDECH